MKFRLLEGGLGRTAQLNCKLGLGHRADIRHRSQRQLTAGREQALVLILFDTIDALTCKAQKARDREIKRVGRFGRDGKGMGHSALR